MKKYRYQDNFIEDYEEELEFSDYDDEYDENFHEEDEEYNEEYEEENENTLDEDDEDNFNWEEEELESEKLIKEAQDNHVQAFIELTNNEKDLRRVRDDDTLSEQEKELLLNDIAEKNMNLVYYCANKMSLYTMTLDDAISAGRYGYAKALKSFDPDKSNKFSTYAVTCIKNEIFGESRRANKRGSHEISTSAIKTWDKNGNEMTILDTIPDPQMGVDEISSQNSMRDDLMKYLDKLSPIEKYIIYMRYGLYKGINMTQKEVAQYVGMSQANVSKIERIALEDLQSVLINTEYAEYAPKRYS